MPKFTVPPAARRPRRRPRGGPHPRGRRATPAAAQASPAPAEEAVLIAEQTRVCGGQEVALASAVLPDGGVEVTVDAPGLASAGDLELHWGVQGPEGAAWSLAPAGIHPAGTRDFGDGKALRTAVPADGQLRIAIPKGAAEEAGIVAVVGILVAGDAWLHGDDGQGDLAVPTAQPDPNRDTVTDRLVAEEAGGDTGLFRRYQVANELLGEAQANPASAGALLACMRLSANRQLPWYTAGNYQGKDMAYLQKNFAENVTRAVGDGSLTPLVRHMFRCIMGTLPRGGGNGDDIRMGILNILRTHGIKEGHRPGIEDVFLGQWHQKLHSSTTVDDIAICEAYLHFLHTGMWDDFWAHLWDCAGLSREDLAAMKVGWRNESGITGPANHMPHMIPDFQHLLWILKVTHSGGDLDTAMQMARGHLPEDVAWDIDDLLQNRDAWWVPGKLVEIRSKVAGQWKNPGCPRDVLLLDLCLESFLRTKIEQIDLGALSDDDAVAVAELALRSGVLSVDDPGLANALHLWQRVMAEGGRWSPEWARAADSALDYMSIALGKFMDSITAATQPAAEALGKAAGVPESYILNFGEEIVRGHPLFVLSGVINRLQGPVRAAGGGSPWTLVSLTDAPKGTVVTQDLAELQGESFEGSPTVLLSETLGGLEDIPRGITAVLTTSPVDVLSHIAIRTRNTGVFLASCSDAEAWGALVAHDGAPAKVILDNTAGSVFLEAIPAEELASGAEVAASALPPQALKAPDASERWVLTPDQYAPGVVGGKSYNLGALAKVSDGLTGVTTPSSVSLPFGTFEKALRDNPAVEEGLAAALAALGELDGDAEAVRAHLGEIRALVAGMELPEGLGAALESAGAAGQLAHLGGAGLWRAVKQVWASKWTERAYLSRRAGGVVEGDLSMAVLLMDLVPAEYAFVLHTTNPITGDANEVFGEVVVGLGEALVGNDPGRPLSFLYDKESGAVEIRSLPSKPTAYFAPEAGSLIARSDSNGEDLETFAGAGLYDSVAAEGTTAGAVDYSEEPLMWDAEFQEALARRLAKIALEVEGARGSPQDIEGAVSGEEVFLLQSRNQIV